MLTNVTTGATAYYVTIPANSQSVFVKVIPLPDTTDNEGDETVTITVIDYSSTTTPYGIGTNNSATITISSDNPCGSGSDVSTGTTCIVIHNITAALFFDVQQEGEDEPFTTSATAPDSIIGTIAGVYEAQEGDLTPSICDAATDALMDATEMPTEFEIMGELMVPGFKTAQAGIRWIELRIELKATGKRFTWDGSAWIEDPTPIDSQFELDTYRESFAPSPGNLNLLDLDDQRRFVGFIPSSLSQQQATWTARASTGRKR